MTGPSRHSDLKPQDNKGMMEVLFEYQGDCTIVRCKRAGLIEPVDRDLAEFVGLPL